MENALNYRKGHFLRTLRKLCLKIGLTAIVMLSVSPVLQADVTHSQNAKINLALENVTLPDVFREIEKQSEYRFFYNRAIVDTESRLNIRVGEYHSVYGRPADRIVFFMCDVQYLFQR